MKTKKTVITVLMAILIIALVISCQSPFDKADSGSEGERQPAPDGKTLVRLNLTDSNARTVMPTTTGYTALTDFDGFTLLIKDSSNATQDLPSALQGTIALASTINSTDIPLAPMETYSFTVTAFKGSNAMALGTTSLAVTQSNKTLTVTLKEIADGSGTGTLTVNPDISAYGTATVSLTPLSANASPAVAAQSIPYTNASIKSGLYLMTIALAKAKCESASVIEVVHIWNGLPTTFSGPLPTLRSNVHLVEYDYTDDADLPELRDESEEVAHGDSITNTDPIPVGQYIFGGWFTDPDDEDTLVDGDTIIIKPLTLLAKWEPSTVDVRATVTLSWSAPVNPTLSGTASYSQSDSTINIAISVGNAESFTSFKWYVDGTEQVGQTGSSLTITGNVNTALNWYQKGTHSIQLVVGMANGNYYSGTATITCGD